MSSLATPEPGFFDRIFIGRVPRGTTEGQLRTAFANRGTELGCVEFVVDRVTGIQRGFAFALLRAPIDAFTLGGLHSVMVDDCALDVRAIPEPLARTH